MTYSVPRVIDCSHCENAGVSAVPAAAPAAANAAPAAVLAPGPGTGNATGAPITALPTSHEAMVVRLKGLGLLLPPPAPPKATPNVTAVIDPYTGASGRASLDLWIHI